MTDITVKQLAKQVNTDEVTLLKQLNFFGIKKSSKNDVLATEEMRALLEKINNSKATLTKKKVTKIMRLDGNHKINVSVKRKRKISTKGVEEAIGHNVKEELVVQDLVDTPLKEVSSDKYDTEETIIDGPIIKEKELKYYKHSGFNIISTPQIQKENNVNIISPKIKTLKKTFYKDQPITTTKHKKESYNRRPRIKKLEDKSFKKTHPKQLSQLVEDIDSLDNFSSIRYKLKSSKIKKQEFNKPIEYATKTVEIYEGITVSDLAQMMSIKGAEIIKILFNIGIMSTMNQSLDQDTAILIIKEMGHKYVLHNKNALEESITLLDRSQHKKVTRAPIVTIMGHVDHGKTSLLDYIRKTRVVSGETGGITQHIGAYSVSTKKGLITFLDTPGHEAFTSMRARGAKSTDIVILVVAADDGVMPQTEEAIQHAKTAEVPIIVAVNKIDKPESNPDKVISELAQRNVIAESWGGDVMVVNISAKTGAGIIELLDTVLLQSEVLDLKAYAIGYAEGVVIESRLEKGRGTVVTLLVQNGSLNQGDIILCGTKFGRVRAIYDDLGNKIKSSGPSKPVEILGLSGVPAAGDKMITVKNEKKAKEVAAQRFQKQKEAKIAQEKALKFSNMFNSIDKEGEQQSLKIILKGDVQGSVEAIIQSLHNLSMDEIGVCIISSAIGGIKLSDVTLAIASKAVIIGFNVRADSSAKKLAEINSVEIRYYNIIYDLIDDIRKAMIGLLSPDIKESIVGIVEVREIYKSSKFISIAGCMVIEGTVKKSHPIRVLRNQVIIYEGRLDSLKRFKEDVIEVKKGAECGIGIANYHNIRVGDQIEAFEVIKISKEL